MAIRDDKGDRCSPLFRKICRIIQGVAEEEGTNELTKAFVDTQFNVVFEQAEKETPLAIEQA